MATTPDPPWRTQRKTAPPRQSLSQDAIVDSALRILDQQGLDALSMRSVASELNTGPASLYAHVANKEELLDLVLERVLGEVTIPPPDADWRDQLAKLVFEVRRVLMSHGDIARVAMAAGPTGPNGLAIGEAYLAILRTAGFPDRLCSWALDRLSLYVTADVVENTLYASKGATSKDDADQHWQQLATYLRALPVSQFPHTVAMADELMSGSAGERFAFGLDVLLAGLGSHLPADT